MEVVGIALWILGGIVAAPVFCYGIIRFVKPNAALSQLLFRLSVLGFAIFTIDLILVGMMGTVGARALVGPVFFPIHALTTLLSAGMFACALLLGPWGFAERWRVVAAVCWLVGVFAIFFQYHVSEAIYGVDGTGGPYSDSP